MAKQFLVNINMSGNQIINSVIAQGTLGNGSTTDSTGLVKVQNLSSLSTTGVATGMIAYDTTASALKVYNGSAWTAVGSGVTSVNSLAGALTIAGTTNQIAVNSASTTITLSLPTNVTLPGKTTFTASTTSAAAINLPNGAVPTTPVSGDIWGATATTNKLYFYDGSNTKQIAFTDSTMSGNTTGSAATLTTPRAIYGNNFDGSAALNQVIASTYGGTGNGFTKFTGPTTAEKTFTLPNASATILTDNALVTVAQGGTGVGTLSGVVYGNGTSAFTAATGTQIASAIGSSAVTNATNATNTAITDDSATATAQYITWVGGTSGNQGQKVTSTALTFTPSTGNLTATKFNGLTISTSSGTLTIANGKTFTASNTISLAAGADGQTFTFPSTGDTVVTLGATQTLTNKTLTSPTINGATMTGTVTVPTPVNGTDAANKNYVDNVAQGVNAHDAVQYATTTTIAGTYTAGSTGGDGGTGVGAIITFTSTGVQAIDSSTNLALNDRVLVKNGVTADSGTASKANGIYTVTTAPAVGVAGILTRATDYDNSIAGDIMAGDLVYILPSTGSTQGNTQWVQTATGTATSPVKGIKIGTDSISFTQFSGASTNTAGAGLVANGNAFDVGTASTARIVVNADNIDLASVSQTNTTTGPASNFVSTVSVDSYGRVTGVNTTSHVLATSSVKGIASFGSDFTVTSGAVTLAANTISGVALGGTLGAITAGTGLTFGGGTYDGSGAKTLSFVGATSTPAGANDIGSTYNYGIQKAVATITGTGSKASWTITHNLNSRDIQVQVYQTTSTPATGTQYAEVEVDIVRTATGTITVSFAVAPALNDAYNVVMIG